MNYLPAKGDLTFEELEKAGKDIAWAEHWGYVIDMDFLVARDPAVQKEAGK